MVYYREIMFPSFGRGCNDRNIEIDDREIPDDPPLIRFPPGDNVSFGRDVLSAIAFLGSRYAFQNLGEARVTRFFRSELY